MTGATGNLTPDDLDEPFVPGERREVADPADQAAVTASQGRHVPAHSGEIGEHDNRIGGDEISDQPEHL